jgi:hypothetical protein
LVDHGGDVEEVGWIGGRSLKGRSPTSEAGRMTTSPATCWNAGRFIGVIVRGSTHGSDGRRDNAAEPSSE